MNHVKNMNSTKQKILLLLEAGFSFSYAYHPGKKWNILKNAYYEWRKINAEEFKKELDTLYKSQYIRKKRNPDGSFSIFLTDKGRIKALHCKFPELMNNRKWDTKWRIVVFDIPENIRQGRNALRSKLNELGFHKLQQSVFVFPYECRREVKIIVRFFKMDNYVHYGVLENIDDDARLRRIFGLK